MSIASAARRGIFPNPCLNGEHGALNGSTANLVRLLREAEEGKGLGSDYNDALEEALVEHNNEDRDRRSKRRDGRPVYQVPSLTTTSRCRRKTRVLPGLPHEGPAAEKDRQRRRRVDRRDHTQRGHRSVNHLAVRVTRVADCKGRQSETRQVSLSADSTGLELIDPAPDVMASDVHYVQPFHRHHGEQTSTHNTEMQHECGTHSRVAIGAKQLASVTAPSEGSSMVSRDDAASPTLQHSAAYDRGFSLLKQGKPIVPTAVSPGQYATRAGTAPNASTLESAVAAAVGAQFGAKKPGKSSVAAETSFTAVENELTTGLGHWASEAIAMSQRLKDSRNQVSRDLEGVKRVEQGYRRRLELEAEHMVKSLPLSFLKEHGYLGEAQSRGLQKAWKALERQGARVRARAWQTWKQFTEGCKWTDKNAHASRAAALCRGFLARRHVAEIRKALEEGSRTEAKLIPLRRRLRKVLLASRIVASCVVANAADKRRRRARKLATAVAMVETAFIRHKTRQQEWREIIQYQHEHVSAARIQRWTRGALVRRRVPLVHRIRRMERLDIMFKNREEVVQMHLVQHGAAVKIQIWWRCLPCRMRALRVRYKKALDKRVAIFQRAYRRHLERRGFRHGEDKDVNWFGIKMFSPSAMAAEVHHRTESLKATGGALFEMGQARMSGIVLATRPRLTAMGMSALGLRQPGTPVLMKLGKAGRLVSALGDVAEKTTFATMSPTNMRATLEAMSPARIRDKRRKDHAAGQIQRSIRAKIARKRLLEKKREREIKAAETIKRLLRVRRRNKLVKRQRALFEGVCRQAMYRRTAKGKAGEIVTAVGRRWVQRRKYMRTRRRAISCQALVRGWIGRRRAEARRAYMTRLGEERHAGAVRWEQNFRRREAEELLKGARSEDLEEGLELHKVWYLEVAVGTARGENLSVEVFLKYCRFGDRRNNGRLQIAKLTALCKDAGITDAKELPVQRVELAFSRLKPKAIDNNILSARREFCIIGKTTAKEKDQSHMLYPGFLATLNDLALQHPDVQKASDAAAARATAESVKVTAGDATKRRDSISSGGGGILRPDDQRLLVLLQKYVLVKSEAGKEACAELQADGRGADQRALVRLHAAAVVIQSSVARGCRDRAVAKVAREARERASKHAVLNWAVLLLQKRFRMRLAMTRAAKLALKRYCKCLDGLTGAEYYFDPKTGNSSWTKPKVLGKFDIPTAIVMPTGDDAILVLMCRECADVVATEICADCDDMFCDACATRLHRSAKTSTHLRVVIDICDECQFQVATKHCKQCQDNFCRTCFGHVHRRGRLRRHTFDPMTAMCHDCGDRPQAKRCFGCSGQGQLLLCRRCQDARHERLTEHDLIFHRCEDVGVVSLKVVRSREEIAAQARLKWLKVQSAATVEKQRSKNREQAAIKIQAVYRGHLARRSKAKFIEHYLLWRMQRLRDDQVRKKRTYKLLKTFGKAPHLKSDTNQELVLKQFPTWWKTTIVDIIRPGVGWHEAAKMVKEQEFFRKQAARRGRAKVMVAKIRVQLARCELRRAKRKEDQLVGLHALAVEAYRHARANGGVSAKHKEDLQQASRKAKRGIKLQEEERQKAEDLLKKAGDNLGALVGPFRLSKTVQRALKQGVLMPFPLSVQKGRAAARVPATHSMREVQKWMIHGRRVRLEPVELSFSHPPPHALHPFVVYGVKDAPLPRAKPTKAIVLDVAAAISSSMATPAAALGAMRTENGELGGDGRGGVDVRGGQLGDADSQAPPTGSSPTLTLDRQWVLPDAVEARAFAMPVLPPLQGASIFLAGCVGGSRPVQLTVKAAAVAAHALSLSFERWQATFDEDSAMYARLERWAAGSQTHSVSLMLRRRYLFDIEKGFEIERRVTEASEFLQTMWYRAQGFKETVMSAAAAELVAKSAGGGNGGGIGTVLDRGAVLHLFKKWVRSDDRDKILVMHRSGPKTNEAVELVGYVRVDLDTPTPVLREFIRRFCGGWLNEHAKGERFLMENSNGVVIRRSKEGAAGCAMTMDMVQERLNKHTRGTEVVVFVQDEVDRKDPEAEVPALLIPSKDLLDPEAMPSFDGDHDGGDEQDKHPVGEIIFNNISRRDSCGGDGSLSSKSSDQPLDLGDEQSSV